MNQTKKWLTFQRNGMQFLKAYMQLQLSFLPSLKAAFGLIMSLYSQKGFGAWTFPLSEVVNIM